MNPGSKKKVALVTMGCARNEVDSEELAARLEGDGWLLVEDAADADIAVVNTCGFVESAKKDSIDAILEAASNKEGGRTQRVVAVGCLAERYGKELAQSLPEADAILGFDDYEDISARLSHILDGGIIETHTPRDRRNLLPLAPAERSDALIKIPGHGARVDDVELSGSAPARRMLRRRLGNEPVASIKIASGCDRRCSFCAIPAFRGSFISRRPTEIIEEARWLADQGVKELVLVSENSTSYGKDLGDIRLLESLLPALALVDGVDRIRVAYLQPAEVRSSLLDVMSTTSGMAPYFDLSFQHASGDVLRNMKRFGDSEKFLELLTQIRERSPIAGVRSNFIVGFPGESEQDFETLLSFLEEARLDAIGVFGYSDEEGTSAVDLPGKLDDDEIRHRVETTTALVEELMAQRAEERIGEEVSILVESSSSGAVEGRALHQGPEVDGSTTLVGFSGAKVGEILQGRIYASEGADLLAEPLAGARK
ncbi:MAG: 30S ribosomal protein S12 methylthiotransferase RimO [Actinomycetes bacterium]